MRILIEHIRKPDSESELTELSEKDWVSYESFDDFRVIHIFVVLDRFTPLKHTRPQLKLKVTCAIHLDWCVSAAIERHGVDKFQQLTTLEKSEIKLRQNSMGS